MPALLRISFLLLVFLVNPSVATKPAKSTTAATSSTKNMSPSRNSTAGFLPTAATLPKTPVPNAFQPKQRDVAYIWSSLFAGVGSGALASVACAPLDLLRTRMQVWGDVSGSASAKKHEQGALYFLKHIARTEGWKGYFRGLGATLATVPLFWGLYFPLYDDLKRTLAGMNGNNNTALVHCASAIGAGAVADVICNPMFVVRTRLQTEALHQLTEGAGKPRKVLSIAQTVATLYKEGGIVIFWRGLTASMLGLSHVGVQFPVYEWLKQQARLRKNNVDQRESPLDLLLASGLSKMTASLLTYPHEVIRSRMMDSRSVANAGFTTTYKRIYAQEGWRGFYSGLHVSLIRVMPNCCVTFLTYELLLRWAKDQLDHDRNRRLLNTNNSR